jgi:hypothetical protein
VTTLRRRVELQAGPLVILLARLPRAVPFLVVAGLLLGGLIAGGAVGGVLLLVLAALLGTLLFLSWPALPPAPRAIRSLVVAVLVFRAGVFLT